MKTGQILEPAEISQEIWFDQNTETIIVNFDRVSMVYTLEEFFEIYERFRAARDLLLSNFNIVIGTYEIDGVEKTEPVIVSDEEEDYH